MSKKISGVVVKIINVKNETQITNGIINDFLLK